MLPVHRHAQTFQGKPSAYMKQTMRLLCQPALELRQSINAALAENPALEVVPNRRCPSCGRYLPETGHCPICSLIVNEAQEAIVFLSPREPSGLSRNPGDPFEALEEMPVPDYQEDLPTHVLRSIAGELSPEDRNIAAYLLTNLDDNGLLNISMLEICRTLRVLPSRIEKVLAIIHKSDPPGVGARSIQEAFLIQVQTLAEQYPVPPYLEKALREGYDWIINQQTEKLAQLLDVSPAQIKALYQFIKNNLNPYPAQANWDDGRHSASINQSLVLGHPDIIITQDEQRTGGRLIVEIMVPLGGTLRVSKKFREAMKGNNSNPKLKEQLEQSALFAKCLRQRNNAMLRMMEILVKLQKDYILHGDAHSKPITRAQISKMMGVHETTISRAVSNKIVQLPNRKLVEMSSFFDRSLHIRALLKKIIAQEPAPYSDAQLAEILTSAGHPVERRTVTKYRKVERIPAARYRKKHLPRD